MLAYQISNLSYCHRNSTTPLYIKNLEVEKSKIFGVIGRNGSGKTTLLKILSFLLHPKTGEIRYFSSDISWKNSEKNLQKLRLETTLLMQNTILFQRTVAENIGYGLHIRKKTKNISQKISRALLQVGLDANSLYWKKASELSGGEAKMVALASRIILQPRVLLLDEPMAHIDENHKNVIFKVLKTLARKEGTTIIISGHSRDDFQGVLDGCFQL